MDVSTFYALFSATSFTLVGLWWNVVQGHPRWMRDAGMRRSVGGVYLSFLLPALMGLFAQVGGAPAIWRTSFVVIAGIGCLSTVALLSRQREVGGETVVRAASVIVYVAIAVLGAAPEIASGVDLTPIQAEAVLLILLVALGHALAWRFMAAELAVPDESAEPGRSKRHVR